MKKINFLLACVLLSSLAAAQDYWQKVSVSSHKDLLAVCFGSSSTGYIGGTDSTLLKTTDGGKTWTNLPHTGIEYEPLTHDIIDLKFADASNGYAILSNRERLDINGQLYTTTDGGSSWIKVPGIWTSAYRLFLFDANTGYLTGVSPFGGATVHQLEFGSWSGTTYLGTGTSYLATAVDFFNPGTGMVGGDYGYVYRTFDAGRSWDTVKTNVDSAIHALRYLDENTIIAASGHPMTLLISMDKGASWSFETHSGTFYYPDMKAMALSARDSLIAVGRSRTTGKGLIYYSDPAGSWMNIAGAEQALNAVAMRNDSIAYIVGDSGLVLSNSQAVLSFAEKPGLQRLPRVFPNPSAGIFTSEWSDVHRLRVYSADGKMIYQGRRPDTRHQLDLTAWPAGTYILEAVPEAGDKVSVPVHKL